jgi:ADP-ribosyl-[dinitrogen reductase] hydrolase
MDLMDRFRGCLLGLAVGDAVGTAVEFRPRGSFKPVTDMVGGGPFHLQAGQWTDDTSMALCLGASLLERNGFDARDQMERYWRWYRHGYMSSTGTCFDIGNTTRKALQRYKETGEPFSGSTAPYSAGNGSIMRLAPVVLFYYPHADLILKYAADSSRTTHAAAECLDACRLLGTVLQRALNGMEKRSLLMPENLEAFISPSIREIATGSYFTKAPDKIMGTGYVVKSLEGALWSFWNSESFEESILTAVNLGDDADTTAAVCGQMAGAFYGEEGIPSQWLDRLALREEIVKMAEGLYQGHDGRKQ